MSKISINNWVIEHRNYELEDENKILSSSHKTEQNQSQFYDLEYGQCLSHKKRHDGTIPSSASKFTPVGFPSPARDYFENVLDLNQLMVTNQESTYFVKVEGCSMVNSNILPNDILVVDRTARVENNKIVVANLEGDMIVKRLKIKGNELWLYSDNECYQAVKIEPWMTFNIWGVVTWVIHKP